MTSEICNCHRIELTGLCVVLWAVNSLFPSEIDRLKVSHFTKCDTSTGSWRAL